MEAFPLHDLVQKVLGDYFRPEGRPPGTPYRLLPMWRQKVDRTREGLAVLASFVEVHLAREGHDGPVGINLLTKVQLPNLATLYGAMLAGVDYVLMGAGIPRDIPGVLDSLAAHRPATIPFGVEEGRSSDSRGRNGERELLRFDPRDHWLEEPKEALTRPRFLPIVAAGSLARMLVRKANGAIDGFIVEGPTAGGHNAPPRGRLKTDDGGEPIYGERDEVDPDEMRKLGLPFWLAGGEGSPEALRRAREVGAAGVQVGTLFAYAEESGLDPAIKQTVLGKVARNEVEVRADVRASPTGFPFQIVQLEGTASSPRVYEARKRKCDLGYLRTPYRRDDGRIGYRCPAEPVAAYVRKGGREEDTQGRQCLCNALMADVGRGQVREEGTEPPLVTSGSDLSRMGEFLGGRERYSAKDVVEYLVSGVRAAPRSG